MINSMHTVQAWSHQAGYNIHRAQNAQLAAEAQCDLSRKAHNEAGEANLGMYKEVADCLEKKVQISHNLLSALKWRAETLTAAMALARQSLAKLEVALLAKEAPLKLCNWHIEERKTRPRRELVRDVVEEQLEEEKAIILDSQKKISDAIRRTKALILDLEAKLLEVRHDIDNKVQAVGLDEMCLRSAHASFNTVLLHTERAPSAGRTVKFSKWRRGDDHPVVRESRNNELIRERKVAYLIGSTERYEEGARAMFDEHERMMIACTRGIEDAGARLEQAVQVRLRENQKMRSRLDVELKETESKIDDTMNTIAETRFQITALEEPVDLAGICGTWRGRRADPERIIDPVTTRFTDHQNAAIRARRELIMHQQSIHSKLQGLQDCRDKLTEDIADKLTAYNIDQACLKTRAARSAQAAEAEAVEEGEFFAAPPIRNEYMDSSPAGSTGGMHREDRRVSSSAGSVHSMPRTEFSMGGAPGGDPRLPMQRETLLNRAQTPIGAPSPTPSGASTPVSIRSGRSAALAEGVAGLAAHGPWSPPTGARSRSSQASNASGLSLNLANGRASPGMRGLPGGFGGGGFTPPMYPVRPSTRDAWPSISNRSGQDSFAPHPVSAR